MCQNLTGKAKGRRLVLCEVVGDAGLRGVHISASELLSSHILASGSLHERRASQEDGAVVFDNDVLVGHGRNVGAASGAGAEHSRDLRKALRRHSGLVEEDTAEVLFVGEDLVLKGQEGTARVHEVDARQVVLARNLLRAQVLLHRQRVVGAALHRRVIRHEKDLTAMDEAHARHDAGGVHAAAVHLVGRQGRELQEVRAWIDDGLDALAGQGLAAAAVQLGGLLAAAGLDHGQALVQLRDQPLVVPLPRLEGAVLPRRRHAQARVGGSGARRHALLRAIPHGDGVHAARPPRQHGMAPVRLSRLMHGDAATTLHDQSVQHDELLARLDGLVGLDRHGLHGAIKGRVDFGLQLHGRHEHQDVSFLHLCANTCNHLYDGGLDGRRNRKHLLPGDHVGLRCGGLLGAGRCSCGGVQRSTMPDHEGHPHVVVHELRVQQYVPVQVLVRVDALQVEALQGPQRLLARGLEGRLGAVPGGEADELADQRVVVHARLAALVERGVDADALACRLLVLGHLGAAAGC
mmetsp:Transcript_165444/g.530876  ORF Transcript_165444/g.530876 Transcript_165444/m.530876 type:complete len:520 (-) Transcript_165444:1217-2776(-)